MHVVNVFCFAAGRILKVAVGVWLLASGMALATFGGLVMMMAGVFLTVTGLAGLFFAEGVVLAWRAGHAAAAHAQRHNG